MSCVRSRFWFLPSSNSSLASMNRMSVVPLALVEDQDRGRDAGAEEQIGRQADDGFQQVLLDQLLADLALGAAPEQHAVRHDDANPALAFDGRLDHVADEGVVALALGRRPAPEAVVRIVLGHLGAPLVEREGRIGHHDVELHQPVVLDQLGAGDRVAPLDAGAIHARGANMFIRHNAQVLPFISWPKSEKSVAAHLPSPRGSAASPTRRPGRRCGCPAWAQQPGQQDAPPRAACRTRRPSCRRRWRTGRSGTRTRRR